MLLVVYLLVFSLLSIPYHLFPLLEFEVFSLLTHDVFEAFGFMH